MSKTVGFDLIQKDNVCNNSTNSTDSSEQNDENVDDCIDLTSEDNDPHSEQTILNNSSEDQESSYSDIDYVSKPEESVFDTAFISIPPVTNKTIDDLYTFIITDERCKSFISKGEIFKIDDFDDDVYDPSEIDQIINDVIIYGVHYYLVKWTKWSQGFNTWERFKSLSKSHKLVYDYINLNGRHNANQYQSINGIHLMLSRKVISSLFDSFRTQNGLSLPSIVPENLCSLFNSLDVGAITSQLKLRKFLKSYFTSISLGSFRQNQLSAFKQWEHEINVVSDGFKIVVENNIDLEGPPNIFVYVTCYIPQPDIIIPDDPPIGCTCNDNCENIDNCCYMVIGPRRPYDINKKKTVAPGFPIFECNKNCKCSYKCCNRVVQLGSQVQVCIYKTSKYGWGVKTCFKIKKGQFVAKYFGEIITVTEAHRRLVDKSSSIDCMWNLEYNSKKSFKFIIDGSHYANYTYFINHSCNANLAVNPVWIDCQNKNLPELALFATRDILVDEPLTVNYFARGKPGTLKKSGQRCKCDMKNCKGYYF